MQSDSNSHLTTLANGDASDHNNTHNSNNSNNSNNNNNNDSNSVMITEQSEDYCYPMKSLNNINNNSSSNNVPSVASAVIDSSSALDDDQQFFHTTHSPSMDSISSATSNNPYYNTVAAMLPSQQQQQQHEQHEQQHNEHALHEQHQQQSSSHSSNHRKRGCFSMPHLMKRHNELSYFRSFLEVRRKWLMLLLVIFNFWGGATYGYNLSVVAGVLSPIQSDYPKVFHSKRTSIATGFLLGLVSSCYVAGGMIGCLLGGVLSNWLGRKTTSFIAGALTLLGSILSAVSPTFWFLNLTRVVVGMGNSMSIVSAPMMVAEMAFRFFPKIAGVMGNSLQLGIAVGILLGYVMCLAFMDVIYNYRFMFAMTNICCIPFMFMTLLVPESPVWLETKLGISAANTPSKNTKTNGKAMTENQDHLSSENQVGSRHSADSYEMENIHCTTIDTSIEHRHHHMHHEGPMIGGNSSSAPLPLGRSSSLDEEGVRLPSFDVPQSERSIDVLQNIEENKSRRSRFIEVMGSLFCNRKNVIRYFVGFVTVVVMTWLGINAILFYSTDIFKAAGFTQRKGPIIASVALGGWIVLTTVLAPLGDVLGRRPVLISGTVFMTVATIAMGFLLYFVKNQVAKGYSAIAMIAIYYIGFNGLFGGNYVPYLNELFTPDVSVIAVSSLLFLQWTLNLVLGLIFLPVVSAIGQAPAFWFFGGVGVVCTILLVILMPETKNELANNDKKKKAEQEEIVLQDTHEIAVIDAGETSANVPQYDHVLPVVPIPNENP